MRHRMSPVGAILTLALFSIGPAPGEQAPSGGANAPEITSNEVPVTFSSKVNLVQVPVVVRDAHGRVVENLKKEDFQLFDKGKLQFITKFSVEKTEKTDKTEVKTAPANAPGADTETKPASTSPALPDRYIAYAVDDVHLKSSDLMQARRALNRHLDEALDAKSRAAVFTTSGRVTADFTDDREKLHKAVDSILPWTSGPDLENSCPHVTYYEADYLTNQTTSFSGGLSDTDLANLAHNGTGDPVLVRVIKEAGGCSDEPAVTAARLAVREALDYGVDDLARSAEGYLTQDFRHAGEPDAGAGFAGLHSDQRLSFRRV
jgi:VWFA-related protein